jgi:hypothetical protein
MLTAMPTTIVFGIIDLFAMALAIVNRDSNHLFMIAAG